MFTRIRCLVGACALWLVPAAVLADILVGSASPQTGRYAWLGEQMQRGVTLALSDINAAGGLLGQPVRVHVGDDACDPDQGAVLARKFVEIGAVAVFGHGCSGPSLAAGPIYEEAAIIAITSSASHPDLTEQGWRYHFRLFGRDDDQARLAADYIEKVHSGQNLAIVFDETAYSRNLAATLRRLLRARGRDARLYRGIEVEGLNWFEFIDELIATDIQIAYFAGRTTDVGLLARYAGDREYPLGIIGSDPLNSEQFWLVSGDAGEGTVFTSGPDPRDWTAAANVVGRLRAAGFEPEGYTLHAYAAVQAWAGAVQKAGTLDPLAVADMLRVGTFKTVLGKVGFDAKGDVTGIESFVWYIWSRGRYRPLAE